MCLKAGNSWFWRDFILANWESDCGKVGVALLAWPFKTTSKEKCTCIELGSDGALKPPLASSSQAKPLPYTRRNERTRLCCVQVVVVAEAAQQRKTTVEPKIFLKLTWWIPPACIQQLPPFLQCLTCRKKKARLNVIDQIITGLK